MKLRDLLNEAAGQVTSNDVVGLLFVAALLGPVVLSSVGYPTELPLGLGAIALFVLLALSFGTIYITGVRVRHDMTLARLRWELLLVLPCSLLFCWLIGQRADSFFTAESFYQVSALLLFFSLVGGLLERRAARGTPSDVLASGTSSTAAIGLVIFWMAIAAGFQEAGAVLLLLSGILIVLTVVLRLPGAIVPIYRSRRRRAKRRGHRTE